MCKMWHRTVRNHSRSATWVMLLFGLRISVSMQILTLIDFELWLEFLAPYHV